MKKIKKTFPRDSQNLQDLIPVHRTPSPGAEIAGPARRLGRRFLGVIFFLAAILCLTPLVQAQPNILPEKIPTDISPKLKEKIQELYSASPEIRAKAAYDLGRMGPEAAASVPFLAGILDDGREVQLTFFEQDEASGKAAANIMFSTPSAEAINALGKIGKPAVAILCKALEDKNNPYQGEIAEALGDIGDKSAVQALINIFKDISLGPYVRYATVRALGKLGDSRAVDSLINAMGEEDIDIRKEAAKALGQIKDLRAVEPLIRALKDKDSNVRAYAAWALAEMKDTRAIGPLIDLLRDEQPMDRDNIVNQLRKITGQNLSEDSGQWQQWWEKNKLDFVK